MRFNNYLNEIDEKIVSHIKPFLNEFGDQYREEKFIYRGASKVNTWKLLKTRTDRKPRFIPTELHEFLGDLSEKYFGWNIRTEGVFTGSKLLATRFTRSGLIPMIFIPVDNYKYVWTPETDELYKTYDMISRDKYFDEVSETQERFFIDFFENEYFTSELNYHLENREPLHYEAIFKCNKYILIHPHFWENFKKKIF